MSFTDIKITGLWTDESSELCASFFRLMDLFSTKRGQISTIYPDYRSTRPLGFAKFGRSRKIGIFQCESGTFAIFGAAPREPRSARIFFRLLTRICSNFKQFERGFHLRLERRTAHK